MSPEGSHFPPKVYKIKQDSSSLSSVSASTKTFRPFLGSLSSIQFNLSITNSNNMQFLTILLTVAPLASAWHLQVYRDELYKFVLEDRSGTLGQPCKDLAQGNKVSDHDIRSSMWKIPDTRRSLRCIGMQMDLGPLHAKLFCTIGLAVGRRVVFLDDRRASGIFPTFQARRMIRLNLTKLIVKERWECGTQVGHWTLQGDRTGLVSC